MTEEKAIALRVLAVVRDVYDGGRAIIGERWSLLRKMKDLADRSDAVGMLRYFQECLQSDRGKRVADKLSAAGKKTLEMEEPRIWAIVGEALVDTKIDVCVVRDAVRRKRLEAAFQEYWKKDFLAGAIEQALRQKLPRRRKIVPDDALRRRLDALPFVFVRYAGPGFDRVRQLLEQAAEAYLLGLFEASAVVGRAALEVALGARWDATHRGPAPAGEMGERLKVLIATVAKERMITEDQKRLAERVKLAGDGAAHGREVDASGARAAQVALRSFVAELWS